MVDPVENAINMEVNSRVENVAAAAAAQVDQANKDAEALARAAIQTDHVARLNELEGKVTTWQGEQEQRMTTFEARQAEAQAKTDQSLSLILSKLTPQQPPPENNLTIVQPTTPEETAEQKAARELEEQKNNSLQTDTTREKTSSQPARRERRVL